MSRCSLKSSNFCWRPHISCDLKDSHVPLQLSGKHGVNGLSARPRAAKGLEQGGVLAVRKILTVPGSVPEIFLSLRIAY